jgi:hypothetical protein
MPNKTANCSARHAKSRRAKSCSCCASIGVRRQEQNIREALQLAEVDWPDLDGSESVNSMEARIRNADITVVVVRYSRTHWKEARDIARQYGKQFVMATRGYGVTHLAQQIVQQCARTQHP